MDSPRYNFIRSSAIHAPQASAIVLLLVSCAGFAGEYGYLFELTTHFKVFYLIASLVLILLFALLRRWRWLIVAALCLIVNAAYVLPLYIAARATTTAASPAAATLRVLHANVNAGNRNFDLLINSVREEQPDVFVVQEATRGWLTALEVLRDTYTHRLVVPNRGEQHLALYSRLPLAEVKAEVVAEESTPPAYILARVTAATQREITILTMHPPNPPDPERTTARNRDLAFAAEVARQSAKPFLIIGDLNITMWSPYFARLKRDGTLRDVRTGFGVLPSWSPSGRQPLIPIDHCLVSPEITVRDVRTGANISSDHRPLIVELAF